MAFYVVAGDTLIDEFTKPERIVKAFPWYKQEFEAMWKRKQAYEEAASTSSTRGLVGMIPGGNIMLAAQVPWPVLAAMIQLDPYFVRDTKRFYRWLNKKEHQVYKIGRYINRSSLGCRLS